MCTVVIEMKTSEKMPIYEDKEGNTLKGPKNVKNENFEKQKKKTFFL